MTILKYLALRQWKPHVVYLYCMTSVVYGTNMSQISAAELLLYCPESTRTSTEMHTQYMHLRRG